MVKRQEDQDEGVVTLEAGRTQSLADLDWLLDMARKAPPGWWKKGDGKRLDRIEEKFKQLAAGDLNDYAGTIAQVVRAVSQDEAYNNLLDADTAAEIITAAEHE